VQNIIDFHHHWLPRDHSEHPERYMRPGETMNTLHLSDGQVAKRISRDGMAMITMTPARDAMDVRLERMKEANVTAAIFTLGTWVSWVEDLRTCQAVNEEMAKVVSDYPGVFYGAAHLPLSPGDEAARELERCVKDYGFRAFCTGTNVRGRFPDDNQYYPIYEVAETYNLPVIVHAAACPADDFSMREYDLSRMVGREVDHTLAAARVFMSEIPDRFPDLKFIHCHLGGTFWASTFRYGRGEGSIESRTVEQGNEGMGPEAFQRRLKNTYFNTTFWEPRVIKYAVEALGEDQIVFGSDYPIRTNLMQNVAEAIESLDIPDSAKRKIAYENSIRIYGESLVPQQTA
jgi:predicted TIM-barrel fold metal-dependent hydrolase